MTRKIRYEGEEKLKQDIQKVVAEVVQGGVTYNHQGGSAELTTHRASCPSCRVAKTVKGMCGQGYALWETLMGRPPKNLIR